MDVQILHGHRNIASTSMKFSREETKSKDTMSPPATSPTETSIKPLRTETPPLSTSSHTVEAVFSPIRHVPLDLLHEIVFHCLPVHPTIQSASPVISSLSQVSSTWRTAVLSSPRLWSRLFVTIRDEDSLDHCAQMVTRWFQRARSVPLSFFLNIDFEAFDEDIARIRPFLVDLSSVMPKVQHFGLHAQLTTELLYSFVDLDWKFPQLKKLDLFSHAEIDQIDPVAYSVPLFQTAPNLVQVAIQNTITSSPDLQHILPWSQLTDINVAYSISISRWIEIMRMCPKMRVLEVFFGREDVRPLSLDSYFPKGIHSSLERLYLDILNGGLPFLKLLSLVNLPALRTLHVLYHSEPPLEFPRPQGNSMLANLREFSFSAMRLKFPREHSTYLIEILREMVNLEELELQQVTEDFIPLYEAISFKRPEKAMLPRLNTIKLWISSDSVPENEEEIQPLFEMLSSRCKEDIVPVGYEPLGDFLVGVETEETQEQVRKVFGPWVTDLPPQLRVNIDLSRHYRFDQPEGWTFPISE